MHTTTNWKLEPSLMFDVLCCLNVLSGDDFYSKGGEKAHSFSRGKHRPTVR
jgi:hypothetical protein